MRPQIVLFERGSTGHRPVILKFATEAFVSRGWIVERMIGAGKTDVIGAACYAGFSGHKALFIMTADRPFWTFMVAVTIAWLLRRDRYAIYYNYENIYHGRYSIAWQLVIRMGFFTRLFVMDERLLDVHRQAHPKQLSYVPDPWDDSTFRECNQAKARARLGLGEDEIVLLMFGELGRRRGVTTLVEALLRLDGQPNLGQLRVVLAGRLERGAIAPGIMKKLQKIGSFKVDVRPGRVCENDVAFYFHSCDAVLYPNPLANNASSGVVTLALAAGKPVLAPNHGAVGRILLRSGNGIFFQAESPYSLAEAIQRVCRPGGLSEAAAAAPRARAVADKQKVAEFRSRIADVIDKKSGFIVI